MRSSKIGYSHSRSHSHSPHLLKHDHVYHSPKRTQKSPSRTTSKSSKHASHVPRAVSPHISRSSRKSNHVRPKYSRSPSKTIQTQSRSSSPVKDLRSTRKHSDSDSPPGCHSSISKKKKPTKSPAKQYNSKVKLSETSLFAELVRDRQMRELAMKCLTGTKNMDENEVVEIHDDSDNEQNDIKIDDTNIKLHKNSVNHDDNPCEIINISQNQSETSKLEVDAPNENVSSIILDSTPKTPTENLSPPVSKVENGVEHSLEPMSLLTSPNNTKPEVIETKDLIKMSLPLPPIYPDDNTLSPDSEMKGSKRSIKDLPLPPGKYEKKCVVGINSRLG